MQTRQSNQNTERTKSTTIFMNKETNKMMQPSAFIPPLASELNTTKHSQIETQPKNQSIELDHCQSNGTNINTHMWSLFCSETCESVTHLQETAATLETVPSADEGEFEVTKELCEKPAEGLEEDNGRERQKRHRIEVAGRVWIPDIWGQEEMLKDWIDCSAFDASLVPTGIMSARAALAQEGRRANSDGLRI